jgi:hypothetical protein
MGLGKRGRLRFFSERRLLHGAGSRQDAVEANFGPPSWNAILYDSPERQEQAEAAIEANRVRYLRPRRVRR